MHHRHESANIPIEILRTLIQVAISGSLSKAAETLKLSLPAVSGQMKRLSVLVGGAVFGKKLGATVLTERGKLVLRHAKIILEQNDQLLALAGGNSGQRHSRLGISPLFVDSFLAVLGKNADLIQTWNRGLYAIADNSEEIAKGLTDGYLDAGCFICPPGLNFTPDRQWSEELVWNRARDFGLMPGVPVPLVGWPEREPDRIAFKALETAGVPYRLAFSSPYPDSRLAAIAAGLGFGIMVRSTVLKGDDGSNVIVARDRFLPELGTLTAGIYMRGEQPSEHFRDVLNKIADSRENSAADLKNISAATSRSRAAKHRRRRHSQGHLMGTREGISDMSAADDISRPSKRVLVVDDDNGILEHIAECLRHQDIPVRLTSIAAAFLSEVADFHPSLVFIDLSMPGHDGIDVLRELRERKYTGDVVLMSDEHECVLDAARRIAVASGLNVVGVLPKPFTSANLLAAALPPSAEAAPVEGRQVALGGRVGPYFRPKVDLKRGEIVSAQAYSPSEVAADGRKISPLQHVEGRKFVYDFRVAEKTAELCAALNASGRELNFTINLPSTVVLGNEFQSVLYDLRNRYRLGPGQLTVELTDAEASPAFEELVEAWVKLRIAGIYLSVDGFGNGHESFRKLQRLPLSEIKMDRVFIAGLTRHSVELTIMRSIADLGHSLGCTVVADGVSSAETLDALKEAGCDVALGEIFSPPLNEAGLRALLADSSSIRRHFDPQTRSMQRADRQF